MAKESEPAAASMYWRDNGVLSRSWTATGMFFTVSDVALLNRSNRRMGNNNASDNVNLSRSNCVSSFLTCARTRFITFYSSTALPS